MADKTMRFDITADDKASAKLAQVGVAIDVVVRKLDELGRKRADPRVTADTQVAKTRLDEVAAALRELKNQRVRIDIDIPDRSQVGDLRRELSYLRDARVKIDLRTGSSQADLAELSTALSALRDARISVDVDTGTGGVQLAALAAAARELKAISPVKVRVDVTSALPRIAELERAARALRDLDGIEANASATYTGNLPSAAELRRAARALRDLEQVGAIDIRITVTGAVEALAQVVALRDALRGLPRRTETTVNVDVDRSLVGRLGAIGSNLAKLGALGGVAAAGALQATSAVASLAGSLISVAGVAPVAVAGLAGLGAVYAVVKAGFAGTSTEASAANRELVGFTRAYDQLSNKVSATLFEGLAKPLRELSKNYLPVLRAEFPAIASGLNGMARSLLDVGNSAQTVRDVRMIFADTATAMTNARPAAANLVAALRDIAAVGSGELPGLGTSIANATGRFREFIAEARQSGQLQEWIDRGKTALSQLGQVAGNVGGVLGSIYSAAKASGADFLTTLVRITGELDTLLASTRGQNALTEMFRGSRETIDQLLPGVRALAGAALDMVAAFAQSGGLQRAGQVLSDIAEKVAPLGAALGKLAGDTLGRLADGAGAAAGALGPLVSIVGGLLGALGPLPGVVLAAVVAYRSLGVAAAAFAAAGARSAAAAAAISASFGASFVPGSAAAAAGLRGLGTALTTVGRLLPVAAVALVAFGAVSQAVETDFDGLTQKVATGAITMSQAMNQAAEESRSGWLGVINWLEGDWDDAAASAMDTVKQSVEEYRNSLAPMQQLQMDVATAQAELNDAVVRFGASSPEARAAAMALAEAQGRLDTTTRAAADAGKTQAQVLREQTDAARSALGAQIDLEAALARVAASQKSANDAVKQHGAGSAEAAAALREYASDADAAAQAAGRKAEADAKAAGATNAADVGSRAYGATLLQLAANASGPAQQALLGYIAKLDDASLAALSAGAEASGFATTLLKLPDGRTVKIAIDPETGKIISTQQLLDDMHDKTVVINGNIVPFETSVRDGVGAALLQAPTIPVKADPAPFVDAVTTAVQPRTSLVTAIPVVGPAAAALDTNARPRNSLVTAVPVVGPAAAALDNNARPRNSTVTAVPMVGAAAAALAGLTKSRDMTVNVYYRAATAIPGVGAALRSGGGIVGYSGGGIVRRASGGMVLPGYAPGRDTELSLLSRGESVLVPELTRQLGAARIMAANREASGGRPGTNTGSIAALMDGRIGRAQVVMPPPRPAAGATTVIAPPPDLAPLRAEIASLRADLRDALKSARPINVTSTSADPVEVARSARLALRM